MEQLNKYLLFVVTQSPHSSVLIANWNGLVALSVGSLLSVLHFSQLIITGLFSCCHHHCYTCKEAESQKSRKCPSSQLVREGLVFKHMCVWNFLNSFFHNIKRLFLSTISVGNQYPQILCDASYSAPSNKFITFFKLCKIKIYIDLSASPESLKAGFNLGYFLTSKMLPLLSILFKEA